MGTNGIDGKLTRLLVPLHAGSASAITIRALKAVAEEINSNRNEIVHSGHFMNQEEANGHLANAKRFVETLVGIYHPQFSLPEIDAETH